MADSPLKDFVGKSPLDSFVKREESPLQSFVGGSPLSSFIKKGESLSYPQIALRGLKEQSLPALAGQLTGVIDKPDFYKPKDWKEHVAYGVGEYSPDILLGILSIGQSVSTSLGARALTEAGKQGLKIAAKKGLKVAAKKELAKMTAKEIAAKGGMKAAITGLSREAIKTSAKPLIREGIMKAAPKALAQQAAGRAIEGASLLGVTEMIHEPLRQYAKTGKIDVKSAAGEIVTSAVIGGVSGVALMPLAWLAGTPVRGLQKMLGPKKGISSFKNSAAMRSADKTSTGVFEATKLNNKILDYKERLVELAQKKKGFLGKGIYKGQLNKTANLERLYQRKLASANAQALKIEGFAEKIGTLDTVPLTKETETMVAAELGKFLGKLPKTTAPGRLKAIQREITSKAKMTELRNKLFRDNLGKYGYGYDEASRLAGQTKLFERALNMTELMDRIETTTGEKVTNLPAEGYEAASRGQNYVAGIYKRIHTVKKEFPISGERLGELLETPLTKVSSLSLSDQKARTAVAGIFKDMRDDAMKKGLDIGYIEAYMPRRLKMFLTGKTTTGMKSGLFKKLDPVLEKKRFAEEALDPLYKKDAWGLVGQYASDVGRVETLTKILPKVNKAVLRLRAKGADGYAADIEGWFARASNLNKKEVQKFFAADFINRTTADVDNLVSMLKMSQSDKGRTFINEITRLMYKSWIGLNPRTILFKQPLQNRLVGGGEIGIKSVEVGARARQMGRYKDLLNEIRPSLRGNSIDFLEEAGWRHAATGTTRKILDALAAPGELGMKAFTKLDLSNREGMFMGAYLKLKRTGLDAKTLEHLLPGQKRMVKDAFLKGGIEAAAKRFGLIQSHRVNYMYSAYDTPLLLQGELGKFIPFTTWGRNQWNRFYGDIVGKSTTLSSKQLAKRAVYPLAYLGAFKLATGYEIQGAHPATSALGALNMNVLPQISGVASEVAMGRPGKAVKKAVEITPMGKLGLAIQKGGLYKGDKKSADIIERLAGLKKGGK